jgi:gas vesicle protein
MRMGAFLFGGLIGAAAAMFMNRNNRPVMLTTLNKATETVNSMVDRARNQMVNMTNNASQTGKTAVDQTAQAAANYTKQADTQADLEKVEQMINQDPQVKQAVDEIKRGNGQPSVR